MNWPACSAPTCCRECRAAREGPSHPGNRSDSRVGLWRSRACRYPSAAPLRVAIPWKPRGHLNRRDDARGSSTRTTSRVNRKRVQRLWREEGLRVPAKRRKRQRLGDSAVPPAARLRAERPNHVWALDFQFDQTADGRVLKLLNIVDEHTREALAVVAARRINADATAATLDRIVAWRGTAPGYIRCDNGPELTANALRDWCRFSGTGSSLHRARRAVGEPVPGVVQRPAARRVPGRRAVRQPARSAGADRGLADRVQHEAPA